MSVKIITLSFLSLLASACGSSSSTAPAPSTPAPNPVPVTLDKTSEAASYTVTFNGQWTTTGFGTRPDPSTHFTQVIGSAVRSDSSLWQRGSLASAGTRSLAELGTVATFNSEIQTEVTNNQALSPVLSASSRISAEGSTTLSLEANRTFPLFTFASMIAPSPDWFVGLSEHSLLNPSGEWTESETIQLRAYDAGSRLGNTFTLGGTVSNTNITRLAETVTGGAVFVEGLVNNQAIASMTFTRTK